MITLQTTDTKCVDGCIRNDQSDRNGGGSSDGLYKNMVPSQGAQSGLNQEIASVVLYCTVHQPVKGSWCGVSRGLEGILQSRIVGVQLQQGMPGYPQYCLPPAGNKFC